jgi:glycosyltransferase involved in cell wall biosynthesis
MTMPGSGAVRVSGIIPAYNAAPFIREAIGSALAQTVPLTEIVVVDDGSTDETAAIVGALPPPVRLVREPHSGHGVARNLAVAHATGDLLAFLDADDIWAPDKLERQLELLRASPPDAVIFAHAQNFWASGLEAEAERYRDQWVAQPFPALIASTMLVPRALWERVGPFDPRTNHGEVADWLARAKALGATVAVHPATLMRRRIHAANVSRTATARDGFFELLQRQIAARRRAGDAAPPGPPPAP